ncbi:hypothetical protein AUR61_010610 [Stutzerimonas balearica]|uniref:hypothetical protein n=1 Tax=Stutzerimonas balearica TaxID=74829 RepID=UPI0007742036|nr:hypothetical protein [Stutzerimonas balearica]OMG64309.1 hypothetical protein AUR61_010610 [Stutzerimonas balearica]
MIFQILVVVAVAGIVAYVLRVFLLAYFDHQRGKLWKRLPTVDEYLRTANPTKGAGISCIKCGSRQLRERRIYGTRRVIKQCCQCDTDLFRAEHKRI